MSNPMSFQRLRISIPARRRSAISHTSTAWLIKPSTCLIWTPRRVDIVWYPGMAKLSHELMNLRHLQGHVGQLSELLLARGIETDWIGKGKREDWLRYEQENP